MLQDEGFDDRLWSNRNCLQHLLAKRFSFRSLTPLVKARARDAEVLLQVVEGKAQGNP